MASVHSFRTRIILFASLIAFSLIGPDTLRTQDHGALPDYVIEEFGTPPSVPSGPLSDALRSAIELAFVDSMKSSQ
ncbi:MAG: hypothetical protein CL566_09275 [Alphaproteobacteria bacterium]|nr:hypothetical protein [Alphaproteobacteria bacterium]